MTAEATATTPQDISLLTSEHPDIIWASEYSYRLVARREGYNPENIHQKRVCAWITKPMRLSLKEQGYVFYPFGRKLKWCWPHMYLISETAPGLMLVDGAWQQFVPRLKRDPELPKVLVGAPDKLVALAKDAGMRGRHLDYWRLERSPRVSEEIDERFSYGLLD